MTHPGFKRFREVTGSAGTGRGGDRGGSLLQAPPGPAGAGTASAGSYASATRPAPALPWPHYIAGLRSRPVTRGHAATGAAAPAGYRASASSGAAAHGPVPARSRVAFAVAAILLLSTLLAPAVHGQPSCAAPQVALDPAALDLGEGESRPIRVHVLNVAGTPASAAITLTAPSGWSAVADAGRKPVEPTGGGASIVFDVSVTAPSRGTGVASGDLAIVITLTCLPDDGSGSSDTRVDTGVPVSLAAGPGPWLLILAAGLVAAGGIGTFVALRRHRGPWSASVGRSKPTRPGGTSEIPLTLHNRGTASLTLDLGVAATPAGWTAHLATTSVTLDPGEETRLWCTVHVAPDAEAGKPGRVIVRARRLPGRPSPERPRDARLIRLSVPVAPAPSAKGQP